MSHVPVGSWTRDRETGEWLVLLPGSYRPGRLLIVAVVRRNGYREGKLVRVTDVPAKKDHVIAEVVDYDGPAEITPRDRAKVRDLRRMLARESWSFTLH